MEAKSQNFRVIYYSYQSNLVNLVLSSAERSYNRLKSVFNYKPTEKIIIYLTDASDYGSGETTTVPRNFIHLEIEPLEPGYEQILYTNSLPWIISHELVHVFVNDMSNSIEKTSREIFGRVVPEKPQPLTIPFSFLTNFNRYTPDWYQEGIAVFLETWENGGMGRVLSSFDEMYFRSLIFENRRLPSPTDLETILINNSFLYKGLYYLYGTRFNSFLSERFGPDKLFDWYEAGRTDDYSCFESTFKKAFGQNFYSVWNKWEQDEKKFQQKNIKRIKSSGTTEVKHLSKEADGWVTNPGYDHLSNSIIYGFDKPHHLTSIKELNLITHKSQIIGTIPSPSLIHVASTAYDSKLKLFFFTTENSHYRNVWSLNLNTSKKKLLFENSRMGDLTVSPENHELWGTIHADGKVSLVYSTYPYLKIIPLIQFGIGDVLYDLSLDSTGNKLAAVLHRPDGSQSIVIANAESLKKGGTFHYETIYSKGSPENPSWSPDGKTIYFNAYTNGVSNIYKYNLGTGTNEAISNTIRGLFKPVYLNKDSLFVFEFSSTGFIPSIISSQPAKFLPAIKYFGEKIVNKYPVVKDWNLSSVVMDSILEIHEENYNSFGNLKLNTIIPVITGFQKQKVLGLYLHINDPIYTHDLKLGIGYSPFDRTSSIPQRFHFYADYKYKNEYQFSISHNAPNFYDLFDKRKSGLLGTKISLGNNFYWIYNDPLKVEQKTKLSIYRNFSAMYDNLVRVSQSNFFTLETILKEKNLRRSIGSVYYENGNEFDFHVKLFGAELKNPDIATQIYGQVNFYQTWLMNSNVIHLQGTGGYLFNNENIFQSQFFLGGFGNREVDDAGINQYRDIFRFPGIPIHSLITSRFLKIMVENNFPAVRFSNLELFNQILSYSDLSVFSQGLVLESPYQKSLINVGAQINLGFVHWFNLESTLSAGVANYWGAKDSSLKWFVSYKIFREIL